uniref:Smr domain-containing protein n=1 Tax=Arion vulgaris TaxID=1028688 RepID=A0A0B7A1B5_9EUPU
MTVGNELVQGIIVSVIVALVITLCCLFYWCKIRREKILHNAILEQVAIDSQIDAQDIRLQPIGNRLRENKWSKQERKRELKEIIEAHQILIGQPTQPQLKNYKELDLHKYTLKEAVAVFELFLTVALDDYYETNLTQDRFINVITGRGKHSKDGIPVIKLNISDYLVKHSYMHSWPNPGMVRIDLFSKIRNLDTHDQQTSSHKSLGQFIGCSIL